MKISNPSEFFINHDSNNPVSNFDDNYYKLIKRGDIIAQYASTYSFPNENNWSFVKDNDDKPSFWARYSFDNGKTWPIKIRLINNVVLNYILTDIDPIYYSDHDIDESTPQVIRGTKIKFNLIQNYKNLEISNFEIINELWNTIKTSDFSLLAISNENSNKLDDEINDETIIEKTNCFYTNIPNFRYSFEESGDDKYVTIQLLEDLPYDTSELKLSISVKNSNIHYFIINPNNDELSSDGYTTIVYNPK
jgi:hypothetical protein